jgi:hypothetical protein
MNINSAVKFDPIVHRNLHRKNADLSPLRLPSFLGITMGVLMLMAMAAPSAHATIHLLTYYNFNTAGTIPYTSNAPGQQTTHLINDATSPFPSSQLAITAAGGTTLNQWPADATGAGGALDLMGNANLNAGQLYCLDFGGISTTDEFNVTLSFAIASVGNGGQFDTLTAEWGTSNSATIAPATFPNTVTLSPFTIGTNTNTVTYQQVTGALTGADNLAPGTFVWVQFCFFNTKGNNAEGNATFLDNIQVTGVPEPSTYIGALLGLVGLCWYQRRWFARFLGLRPA